MKFNDKALKLIKRFAAGVSCPEWSEDTIKSAMFYSYCKDIAERKGKKEIDEEVVKEYILKEHNPITVKNGRDLNAPIDGIRNCMVRPDKKGGELICVHGKAMVCSITKKEAEFLEKKNQELLRSLQ
jgi:hypothetical protein